jgi:succinoglycan biosynthesis transport protein ExoP
MNRGALPVYSTPMIPVAEPPHEPEDGPLALARALIAGVGRYKFRLTAWIATCALLAAVYAHTIVPSYTASARLLLEPRRPASVVRDGSSQLDVYQAESEFQAIRSERLLAYVFSRLDPQGNLSVSQPEATAGQSTAPGGVPNRPDRLEIAKQPQPSSQPASFIAYVREQVGSMIDVQIDPPPAEVARQEAFANFVSNVGLNRVGQSYVVEISFTSPNPALASSVANAIVSAYLWQSLALKADAAVNGGEFLQPRVDALSAQAHAAAAAVVAGTIPDTPTPDADARIIGAALQPLEPSAPRTKLIIALGSVLGLISGSFTIFAAQAMDRRVYTPAAVSRATGLPCLAAVPEVSRRRLRRAQVDTGAIVLSHPQEAFATAIRDLRSSLSIGLPSGRGKGSHVVAVASWARGAGCTLISQNLARVIRGGGRRVTLIDADLQGAVGNRPGEPPAKASSLADMLIAGARPEEVSFLSLDGVDMLPGPSRDVATNYFADLGGPEMGNLVDYARTHGDVLLDLPPLSAAVDAKAAALQADGVVIVVVAGRTTTDDLASALRALRQIGANVIGVVLNRVK